MTFPPSGADASSSTCQRTAAPRPVRAPVKPCGFEPEGIDVRSMVMVLLFLIIIIGGLSLHTADPARVLSCVTPDSCHRLGRAQHGIGRKRLWSLEQSNGRQDDKKMQKVVRSNRGPERCGCRLRQRTLRRRSYARTG